MIGYTVTATPRFVSSRVRGLAGEFRDGKFFCIAGSSQLVRARVTCWIHTRCWVAVTTVEVGAVCLSGGAESSRPVASHSPYSYVGGPEGVWLGDTTPNNQRHAHLLRARALERSSGCALVTTELLALAKSRKPLATVGISNKQLLHACNSKIALSSETQSG